jgi:hypothetical protein
MALAMIASTDHERSGERAAETATSLTSWVRQRVSCMPRPITANSSNVPPMVNSSGTVFRWLDCSSILHETNRVAAGIGNDDDGADTLDLRGWPQGLTAGCLGAFDAAAMSSTMTVGSAPRVNEFGINSRRCWIATAKPLGNCARWKSGGCQAWNCQPHTDS